MAGDESNNQGGAVGDRGGNRDDSDARAVRIDVVKGTGDGGIKTSHSLAYAGLATASLMLSAFSQELAAGHVPIPVGWMWVIPMLQAGIVGVTIFLPKISTRNGSGSS